MTNDVNTNDPLNPTPNATARPHVVLPDSRGERRSTPGLATTFLIVLGGVAALLLLLVPIGLFAFLFLGVNVRDAAAQASATAIMEQQAPVSVPSEKR